jgi:hypothetical protein
MEQDTGGNVIWLDDTERADIQEMIENGEEFFFRFQGKNYYIERRENGYLIQDPAWDTYNRFAYKNYPENETAKTPEELMVLPFLDGKTIFECFDELRFFDG